MAYNGLIALKNQTSNARKQIDVQLKRRHDLIPNLVQAVQGAMDFEKDTLAAVISARNTAVVAAAGLDPPVTRAVNLFEQQVSNRRKSRWLVLAFLLFFAWLGLGGDFLAWQDTQSGGPGSYRHAVPWGGLALALL